jgi:hypothetical protein
VTKRLWQRLPTTDRTTIIHAVTTTSDEPGRQFWRSFLLAVEAEPRTATEIRGASGLFHPVIAVGVDDMRRRIVLISGASDARAAAFAQHDVQAANPTYRVAVARPIAVNLSRVAAAVASFIGTNILATNELEKFASLPKEGMSAQDLDSRAKALAEGLQSGLRGVIEHSAVRFTVILQEVLKQLSHLTEVSSTGMDAAPNTEASLHLGSLISLDPIRGDLQVGNCPVPLYDFNHADAEALHRGHDIDSVRDVLRRRQLLQYFFPSPDHLVLGFAERAHTDSAFAEVLEQAPAAGHPLGVPELLPAGTDIRNVIAELQDRRFLVEGEIGYELSEHGRIVRAAVQFKPREGFLAKLSRILSLKIDVNLSNLFK